MGAIADVILWLKILVAAVIVFGVAMVFVGIAIWNAIWERRNE